MSKTVVLTLNSCKDCPFFKISDQYSSDSWDRMEDWHCTKSDRKIAGAVEWHEEKKIKIPDWCPISVGAIRDEKLNSVLK